MLFCLDYPLQLDTGSSDLWVKGSSSPLPNVQSSVSKHYLDAFATDLNTGAFAIPQSITWNLTVSVMRHLAMCLITYYRDLSTELGGHLVASPTHQLSLQGKFS